MDLYNVQTREKTDFNDAEALHQAILSGSHAYQAGSYVPVVNPDGEDKEIPAEKVQEAIQSGYKIKTSVQNRVEAELAKPENKGIRGAAKVFAQNAADELALGIPEMVADATQDPFDVILREELKKKHSIANATGGGLGFAGSLLYGGPLWKAGAKVSQKTAALLAEKIVAKSSGEISKSAAKRIARGIIEKSVPKVGGAAAEGLVMSSPIAITEAALGDPEAAAESLLLGVGLGGILGGAASVTGSLGSKFKKGLEETRMARNLRENVDDFIAHPERMSETLKRKAGEKAFEVLDPKKHHLKKFASTEEVFDEFGNAIAVGRARDQAAIGREMIEEGIMKGQVTIADVADRLKVRTSEIGQDISNTFKRLDDTYPQATINLKEISEGIRSRVLPELRKNKAISKELDRFEKELDILADGDDLLTLAQANTLKSQYQKQIGDTAITESKSFKDLINEIPKEINKQIREKIGTIDKKELNDLVKMQKKLGNLKAAEKIAVDRAEAAIANNDVGLTSLIAGVGGASAFDGGLSIAAGLGAGAAREFSRRYGDLYLSKGYDLMGGLLMAEQSMVHVGKKLQGVQETLKKMSAGTKETAGRARQASIPAIIRELKSKPLPPLPEAAQQERGRGPSSPVKTLPLPTLPPRKQDLKQFRDHQGPLVSNPDALMDRIAELTEMFNMSGAPIVGSAFGGKIAQVVAYLDSITPKPPAPNNPFAPQYEWEPSDYEVEVFEQKVSVVSDPFVVLDELQDGTLTVNHMEALKTVYPVIHAAIQARVHQAATENPEPLKYQDRVKLSYLMDAPMDPSMEKSSLAIFQRIFAGEARDEEGQVAETPRSGGSVPEFDVAKSRETQAQRILGG